MTTFCIRIFEESSIAGPPLFWAARDVSVSDSGSSSDQIGAAPAPGKKRVFQAAPAPLHTLKFVILSS